MGHRHAAGKHAERAYWKNPYGNGLIAPNLWRIFMNFWPLEYIWHICPSNTISKGSVFNSLGLWIRNDLCSTWESADIQHLASKGWISSEKKRGRSATIKDSVPHNKHTWYIYNSEII
jgi:hypothetical protein